MTESEHIAQLAKMTQVFVKPAPVKGKKYSHAYIRQMSIQNEEEEQTQLCPKAEGRIVQVDDKVMVLLQTLISCFKVTKVVLSSVGHSQSYANVVISMVLFNMEG